MNPIAGRRIQEMADARQVPIGRPHGSVWRQSDLNFSAFIVVQIRDAKTLSLVGPV